MSVVLSSRMLRVSCAAALARAPSAERLGPARRDTMRSATRRAPPRSSRPPPQPAHRSRPAQSATPLSRASHPASRPPPRVRRDTRCRPRRRASSWAPRSRRCTIRDVLAPKPDPELRALQPLPEALFRRRRRAAHLARVVGQELSASDHEHLPPRRGAGCSDPGRRARDARSAGYRMYTHVARRAACAPGASPVPRRDASSPERSRHLERRSTALASPPASSPFLRECPTPHPSLPLPRGDASAPRAPRAPRQTEASSTALGERRGETHAASRPRSTPVGATPMRAREWVPEMGGFGSVDEYSMQDFKSALWGWPRQSPIRFSDPTGQGPLDFASCLLHGGGWSQCVQAERDRFSHGPLGDCTNSPEACFGGGGGSGGAGASPGGGGGGSGGSGSGPYRSPDTPDPDFSPCSGVFGLSRLTCCRNLCTGAPADAPPVCVPLPPKGSRERDCLQRCFANPH